MKRLRAELTFHEMIAMQMLAWRGFRSRTMCVIAEHKCGLMVDYDSYYLELHVAAMLPCWPKRDEVFRMLEPRVLGAEYGR